jgi:hypothetical protein
MSVLLRLAVLPLGCLTVGVLGAQSAPHPVTPAAAGATVTFDTLDYVLSGIPQAAGKTFRSRAVRTEAPGSGAETGLLVRTTETLQMRDDGGTDIRLRERATVDARTRTFRSASRRMELGSGTLLEESMHAFEGARIRLVRQRGTAPVDTSFGNVAASGAPLYSFDDILHVVHISEAWRGTFDIFSIAPPFHIPFIVDSTVAVRAIGTAARWQVFAHIDSAGQTLARVVAIVDSSSTAVLRTEWQRKDGTHTIITSARFADSRTPAAPLSAVGDAERNVAGHYYLQGEREVGSELLLTPDGRFQYMLAYGALDETSAGQWRVENGSVVLQTDGIAHPPSVTLRRFSGRATGSIRVFVHDTLGRPVSGIEVDVVGPRSGTSRARTTKGICVLHFARNDAPTEISVGYDVMDFMVAFPLKAPAADEYHFVFNPGDLGTRRFDGDTLRIEEDAVIITRNDHAMRYIRR